MKVDARKNRVYVAMSGGVDSSVAATLLTKQGHDVTGVFFKPWSPYPDISYCDWQQDRQDAMRTAVKIGIKFKTWDLSKDYGKLVTKYMIDSYKAGITPNPDVMCNKEIKFGLFLKLALKEGADYIATGHYARIKTCKNYRSDFYKLLKGKDENKDQSYFLYTLTQDQLKHSLFPIGDYTKPEVRQLAKKFGLPNYAKKDSQGVCFIGTLDMKEFLKKYIRSKPGLIKSSSGGKVIGRHDGVYYYTIGQRHGLDLSILGGPYFVSKKDIKKNIIYVSKIANENGARSMHAKIENINWITPPISKSAKTSIKIRYRAESIPATIKISSNAKNAIIKFLKPAVAITPGQSAVFYKGKEVIGGGIISQ